MDLTPRDHLVCVARERLSDILLCEGASENHRSYADRLACAYWRQSTVDCILQDLQFIFAEDEFAGILGFCKLHYPILFATIPLELKSGQASPANTQHNAAAVTGILDSAACRASSFDNVWPAAFRFYLPQQLPHHSME